MNYERVIDELLTLKRGAEIDGDEDFAKECAAVVALLEVLQ